MARHDDDGMTPSVVALASPKGGVGRTSIATALACAWAVQGRSVTLFDATQDGLAMRWAGSGRMPMPVRRAPAEAQPVAWLETVLGCGGVRAVIDLPAAIPAPLVLACADLVLMPSGASPTEVEALGPMLAALDRARALRNDGGPRGVAVPWRVRGDASMLAEALALLVPSVAPAIRDCGEFAAAAAARLPLAEIAPRGRGMRDIAALMLYCDDVLMNGESRP